VNDDDEEQMRTNIRALSRVRTQSLSVQDLSLRLCGHWDQAVDLEYCSHDRRGTASRCNIDEAGCVVSNSLHSISPDVEYQPL
jgi:hypothetical protein